MLACKTCFAVILCGAISAFASAPPPLVTPDPMAAPNPTYTGYSVQFTSNISGGVPPYTYAWTFNDGGTDTSADPIHTYTVPGSITITLLVSDSASQSKSLTTQIVVIQSTPLAFTSPPTATPSPLGFGPCIDNSDARVFKPKRISTDQNIGPGEPVVFTCAAVGNGALTFAWDFGDGSTDSTQNPSHTYITAGTFPVTVTVTDATQQTISGPLIVEVNAPIVGTGFDSDGDGISDYIEDLAGTCPYDPTDTPLTNPNAPPTPLNISKMQINLNFAKYERDILTISGTLPVPAGADPRIQQLVFLIGDLGDSLFLGQGSTSLKLKKTNGIVTAQTAQFSMKIGDLLAYQTFNFVTNFQPYGLVNATTQTQVHMPITFIFDNVLLKTTVTLNYKATAGRSGTAKH
ncbi:MAG TPA: PKD domain-containing protein [Planctomycetota bacterium]|nr:PKD domain-containing protein [Planctomycetota bacterium]